jgi:hypothetical protein
MPINPTIALSGEFYKMKDPLEERAQINALARSKEESQLNQLKIGEYKQKTESQNALRNRLNQPGIDLDDPRTQIQLLAMGGGDILKSRGDMRKTQAEAQRAEILAGKEKLGILKLTTGAVMANPTLDAARREVIRYGQLTGDDITEEMAQLDALGDNPESIRKWAAGYALEADKLLPKFETEDLGGTVQRTGYDVLTGAPVSAPRTQRKTMTPGEGARLAQSERQFNITQSNQAPTVTEVVDPNDSSKMIRVDARRYKGGGVGSPGVIGSSGKEPTAAAKITKSEAGKSQLADVVDSIRGSYQRLDKARAIPSTQRGTVSNVLNSIAASGPGQVTGRVVGTEEQKDRDVISSSRLQLLNAIKEATGMSSKSIDSNTELQTWLRSITDPGQSIEAVNEILDNIQNTYGGDGGKGASGSWSEEQKQAAEWVKNNPNDPRAAKIKEKLGM